MIEIVLDTSFLMLLTEKSSQHIIDDIIRIMGPVSFIVPDCVVEELSRLSLSRHVRKSKLAQLALKFVNEKMKVVETFKTGSVDDRIVSFARERPNAWVATMDRVLRERLLRENLKCVTLSNNKVVLC
ncbi:MAG: PIN domain-containing protein [Nitrososphaeria archaeon]